MEEEEINKEDGGFYSIVGRGGSGIYSRLDEGFYSVVGRGGSGIYSRLDEEELPVFNPRAVLPCFVIVYSV